MGLPPKQSVLLESGHGVGKSEIIAQTAAMLSIKLKKPFGLVDIRLGQYEIGDLIGLPRARDEYTITSKGFVDGVLTKNEVIAKHVTVHDLPLWFPREPDSYGFLFFDELNRGSRDTQQWAMQIVLDYKSNFNEVPNNWRVIAACNDDSDVYSILNLDPALYDRFLVIKFRPTVPEWLDYAEKHNLHPAVIKYIQKFGSALDTPEKIEPGKKYASRRSWTKLSATLQYMDAQGDNPINDLDYLVLLSRGYLGETLAIDFTQFIKKDYKVFTAEDILGKFAKLKPEFEKMIATDITFYNKEIVSYIKKNSVKLSKKQSDNLFEYIKTIPRETASGFWYDFRKECPEESSKWYKSSAEVTAYIGETYNKPKS
jgi:MoxR-like ATPases